MKLFFCQLVPVLQVQQCFSDIETAKYKYEHLVVVFIYLQRQFQRLRNEYYAGIVVKRLEIDFVG